METIVNNLVDPSWWFTGFFFITLIKLAPIVWNAIKTFFRKFFIGHRLNIKKTIKNNRQNIAAVNYHIAKAQSYFIMFQFSVALYLIWYTAGNLKAIQNDSFILFLICIIPVYIIEIVWLYKDEMAKELASEYKKFV